MIERIKLLLDLHDNSKDELLLILIDNAVQDAKDYTHNDHIACHESVISNMVVYNYNRLGTEGLQSEGYSGVTFNYTADYPEHILRQLRAHRKLRTC